METPPIAEVIAAREAPPSRDRRLAIRVNARTSREAVAKELGVTPGAVRRWEHVGDPTPRHVVAYVRLLKELEAAA